MGLVNQACKRPLRPKTSSKRKKPKIKDLLYAPKPDSQRYPSHSCMSLSSRSRQWSQAAKKGGKNLLGISPAHKHSPVRLRDLLSLQHAHTPLMTDHILYKYTHLSVCQLHDGRLGNICGLPEHDIHPGSLSVSTLLWLHFRGCSGDCVFVLSAPVLQPSDVFEQPLPAGPKKIEFHISVPEVAAIVEGSGSAEPDEEERGKGSDSAFVRHRLLSHLIF